MELPAERKANILIVDDTVENLQVLARMLESEGYETRAVSRGEMALRAVESDPPELVLLDINMPGMSGYEVCERLKASEAHREIPIIFISALSDAPDKVRAFQAGGVDYVTKPFQLEEVAARVATHLALCRARRELEQSYTKLRKLEGLRDDLVHMMVHDLRSPLTSLLFNLRFIKDGLAGRVEGEVTQDLENAEVAVQAMAGMANDLIDVSRLEHEQLPLQRTQGDLVPVVKTAIDNVRGLSPSHEIVLEADGPVSAGFDAMLIRRVVENLVSNGLKHTTGERPLRVRVEGRDGVRVSVRDQGAGVPAAYREKIFEKFGAIKARGDGKYHSTGLGLAFCRLAVLAHGGQIGVESEEGKGSTFWFTLGR